MAANLMYRPGHTLQHGKYELISPLGRGALGEVWKARDTDDNSIVAIKIKHWSHSSRNVDERFAKEKRAMQALKKCPYVVGANVFISWEENGGGDRVINFVAIVMDYIEGSETLAHRMTTHVPSLHEALRIVSNLLRGLVAAHAKEIVHRDLKPDNVLLNPETDPETAMLIDFGIALVSGDVRQTRVGSRFGTPAYMPLEQWKNPLLTTPRTDIFSAGVLFAELLGISPLVTASEMDVEKMGDETLRQEWLDQIENSRFRAIVEMATRNEYEVVDKVGTVVQRRYGSAEMMLRDVEALREETPNIEPRWMKREEHAQDAHSPDAPKPSVDDRGPLWTETGTDDDEAEAEGTPLASNGWIDDPEPTPRKRSRGWILGVIALVAAIGIGAAMLRPDADPVSAETIVEAPAEPPPPVTPEPVEVKVETPAPLTVPAPEPKVETKPEAKIEAKAEITPKVETKPRVEPEVPKVEPPPEVEVPKPEPAKPTAASVSIANPVLSLQAGGSITVNAVVGIPEGETIASANIRWRIEGQTAGAKPITIREGQGSESFRPNVTAEVTTFTYWVDVRTTSAPGKAIKSPTVTVTVPQ